MARIAVTGGSGFIGTNLVEHLRLLGHEVANFDHRCPRFAGHDHLWHPLDILDRSAVVESIGEWAPDSLVHCAARTDLHEADGIAGYRANTDGVLHALDAVRATPSIRRSVWFSTQLVCPIGHRPVDEFDIAPTTAYGRSKAAAEQLVRDADGAGSAWTIVRPTSIWGPWFGVPYRNFFDAILGGRYVHPGHRTTTKQWGFVGNAAYQIAALLHAETNRLERRTVILSDQDAFQLRDFADAVRSSAGRSPIRTVPYGMLAVAARLGDMAARAGWRSVPLTSFRLHNIVTDEVPGLPTLEEFVGPPPFTVKDGIHITLEWMSSAAASQPNDAVRS